MQLNADESIRQFVRNAVQGSELTRTGWAFHLEIVAVIVMEFLQRLDEQIIDRHPDRCVA